MIRTAGTSPGTAGSEYSEVRTAGRPPSIEMYRWFVDVAQAPDGLERLAPCAGWSWRHRQVQPAQRHLGRLARLHARIRREAEHLLAGLVGGPELLVGRRERPDVVDAARQVGAARPAAGNGTPPLTAFSSIDGSTNGQLTSSAALPCSSASRAVPSSVWVIDGSAPGAVATAFRSAAP